MSVLTVTPEPPVILALDTSTERLAVALHASGTCHGVVAEGGANASAHLLPRIQALLARAELSYADIDFVAFGKGPGAFTGLRTACAVAQGMALGLDKPVLPLDSLLIVAEDARLTGNPTSTIGVAMDARMGEIYAGCYSYENGAWQVLQAPALHSPRSLAEAWREASLQTVAGSALDIFGEGLWVPAHARRIAQEQDRAAALIGLALQAAQAGCGVDAALALPLYLRDKVAQTTLEREASRARGSTCTTKNGSHL